MGLNSQRLTIELAAGLNSQQIDPTISVLPEHIVVVMATSLNMTFVSLVDGGHYFIPRHEYDRLKEMGF